MKVQDFKQLSKSLSIIFSRNKTTTTKSLRISYRLAWLSRYPGSRNEINQDQGGPSANLSWKAALSSLSLCQSKDGNCSCLHLHSSVLAEQSELLDRELCYRLTLITSSLVWGDECSYEVYICPIKADIQKNQNYPWKLRKTQMNHKYKL